MDNFNLMVSEPITFDRLRFLLETVKFSLDNNSVYAINFEFDGIQVFIRSYDEPRTTVYELFNNAIAFIRVITELKKIPVTTFVQQIFLEDGKTFGWNGKIK